ncbi:disintegrin and metalloproteinase domain-containing protein 10-like [Amblyomma americanum]
MRAVGGVRREKQTPSHVNTTSLCRNFILKLRPDASVFHENFTLETETLGRLIPDVSHIYSGQLFDDPSSRVFGALHGGVFEGSIRSLRGRFYVERSSRLFGGQRKPPFHSLVYAENDVRLPNGADPERGVRLCGLSGGARRWMDAALDGMAKRPVQQRPGADARRRRLLWAQDSSEEQPENATGRGLRERPPRRVCNLEITIDHLLHAHFLDEARGEAGRARERVTALVAQHVARASDVFRSTNFGGIEDVSFTVHRIKINDSQSCAGSDSAAGANPFCASAADIAYLLHLTSLSNHDEFCLSYTWTYRDFFGGLLGLAWVANADKNQGGVCEKARPSAVSVGGSAQVLTLSTNVGVLTFLNYNSFVAAAVSEMVFCHELGHNFGAEHDAPSGHSCYGKCAPCGEVGNYIMFPSAAPAKKPNNDKFSPCSLESIRSVLVPMIAGDSPRENCFLADSGPICGNGVVEEGEECDCGIHDSDCTEQCCHARHNAAGAPACTLRVGADCSPSAGQCCDEQCGFKNSSTACGEETECRGRSFCDGGHAQCAPGPARADMTPCANGSRVCVQGECSHSVCLKYGLRECALTGAHFTPQQLCLIACQEGVKDSDHKMRPLAIPFFFIRGSYSVSIRSAVMPNCRSETLQHSPVCFDAESGSCKPGCELSSPTARAALCGLQLPPGSPCNDLAGYCDVFLRCRAVDDEGPLTQLKRLFFGVRSMNAVRSFIVSNPPRAVLVLTLSCWLLALAFRCCAAVTPTSNPHKQSG